MGMSKKKLDELEKLEHEYRDVKNRIEILQKSLIEVFKLNYDIEDLKNNLDYCKIKKGDD